MSEILSGALTLVILVGALLIMVRGLRPDGRAARSWLDLKDYGDGPAWSEALLTAFALGEIARQVGDSLPALAAVAVGFWCGMIRGPKPFVALLPGALGAVAAVMGSITFVSTAPTAPEAIFRAVLMGCLALLFGMFAATRFKPLRALAWFAAVDVIVFLAGPLGVTRMDAVGGLLIVLATVLAVVLAFLPEGLLSLAAAGVVIVQLAGAGVGYLPGDLSATFTMVAATMISFWLTTIVRKRLLRLP